MATKLGFASGKVDVSQRIKSDESGLNRDKKTVPMKTTEVRPAKGR